jgi:alpha-methylacyl-CoA racemase
MADGNGPLAGLKVIELAGAAPAPFGAMLLADLGADVVRVDRAVPGPDGATAAVTVMADDILGRGRRTIAVDMKSPAAIKLLLGMVERADVLIEGYRPGVMERLGLGPEPCLEHNERLVYARMTGWGQDGPMALAAGHDINYIAVAGVLGLTGTSEKPIPPANLVGDFGGGGLLLAFGILAALFERERSGRGQVVDAAMVDGAALLSTFLHGLVRSGDWTEERGANLLDGGCPYYDTYETSDGGWICVGSVEPKFYGELLDRLGLDLDRAHQNDTASWPAVRKIFEETFRARTRAEWVELLGTTDACFAPVLSMSEAPDHPHNVARRTFVEIDGVRQPAPAPRFSRTPAAVPNPPGRRRVDGTAPLADWGVATDLIQGAVGAGALAT